MDDKFFKEFVVSKLSKLDDDIDEIKRNVTDLCVRTSVMESDFENNIKQQIASSDKKYKVIAVVFGCISAIATITNIIR